MNEVDELGALSAGLKQGPDGSPYDNVADGEDKIDPAALAALSKAPPQRGPIDRADAEDSRVNLTGASDAAAAGGRSPARGARTRELPPAAPRGGLRGYALLFLGFALGVPVGGQLWPAERPASTTAPATVSPAEPGPVARIEPPAAPEPSAPAPSPTPAAAPEPPATEASPVTEASHGGDAPSEPSAAAPADPASSAAAPSAVPAPPIARAAAAPNPKPATLQPAAAARPTAPALPPVVAITPLPAVAAAPAASAAAAPQSAPSPAAEPRSVDALLDQALASQQRPSAVPVVITQAETLPETPSRDDVKRAMTVLLPAIRGCAGGQSGLATIGIVVRNDGRVANAEVTGAPFEGTASGRCMAGVVRRAKFPQFRQDAFRVQFPFAIQ